MRRLGMERTFEQFTLLVLKINKLIQRIKTFEIRGYGLKAVHVLCVYFLNENPQGLTAAEIVKLTVEDKAAISRALAELKSKGFADCVGNGRNAVVTLTESGKALAEFIDGETSAAEKACNLDFSDEERQIFYNSLKKIEENIQIYYENLLKKDIKND